MDLDELRVLLAVAETGSVQAASERLQWTRTTVRRRIDSLEAQVGGPLLYRGATGAVLTEAGELVAIRARTILDEAAALVASAREVGESVSGTLRVLLPVGLPPHALLVLFEGLRAAHPRLRYQARFAEDPLSGALEDVDLVFHFGARLSAGPWITRVVVPMRETLLCSPAYVASAGLPRSPRDLVDRPLYVWRRPGADPSLLPLANGDVVRVSPTLVTSDVHILHHLAAAGHGLVFVPHGPLPDPLLPEDALVTVLGDVVTRDCPMRMVVPEAMAWAPKVRRILDGIASLLGADPS